MQTRPLKKKNRFFFIFLAFNIFVFEIKLKVLLKAIQNLLNFCYPLKCHSQKTILMPRYILSNKKFCSLLDPLKCDLQNTIDTSIFSRKSPFLHKKSIVINPILYCADHISIRILIEFIKSMFNLIQISFDFIVIINNALRP